MVIQLPAWKNWRIEGSGLDWQMQERVKDTKAEGGMRWKGTNFWPSADFAVAAAYERTLKENNAEFGNMGEFIAECRRVKDELVAAVLEAVG